MSDYSIGKRAEDQKTVIRLQAISTYVALAAFAGAIVLWIGDARIDQGTRPLSDKQIEQGVRIDNLEVSMKNTDHRLERIEDKIDQMMEALIKK